MKPVALSELMMSLEFESDDFINKVDLENGRIVMVEKCLLEAIEAGEDDEVSNADGSPDTELEAARAIVEDVSGERFVDTPDKWDFHEYRQMERFIGTISDAAASEELWRAIKGRGAFRCFKDTASRLGVLEAWYRYRAQAMREFVVDWATANEVPFIDDKSANPSS